MSLDITQRVIPQSSDKKEGDIEPSSNISIDCCFGTTLTRSARTSRSLVFYDINTIESEMLGVSLVDPITTLEKGELPGSLVYDTIQLPQEVLTSPKPMESFWGDTNVIEKIMPKEE